MRVLRVLVGVLLLLIAVPTLIVGAGACWAMQHRDANGDFRAPLQTLAAPGYAVVVPDLDALLRRDAPFARLSRTRLAVSVRGDRQIFIGVAAPADVAEVLGGAGYTRIDQVRLGRGPLELHATALAGSGPPPVPVPMQGIWLSVGSNVLPLDPASWRGERVALVVTAADGGVLSNVTIVAALDPHWLHSATWGLLIAGPLLLLIGFAVLAWAPRSRPVLYVLDTVPPAPVPPQSKTAKVAAPAVPQPPARAPAPVGAEALHLPIAGRAPFTRTPVGSDPGRARRESGTRDGADALARHESVAEGLPGWPVREVARRTERAVSAPTEELPVIAASSPLDIPTSEMPLVGAPVRMRLTR